MLDSVSEQSFFTSGNLEYQKQFFEEIDRIEEERQKLEKDVQMLLMDCEILKYNYEKA